MKSKGYTLWLVPTGEVFRKFSNIINKLAKDYDAPVFDPHVTLLGEIMQPEDECIVKTKQLVKNQKPFIVNLEAIGYQDYYWRTLFVYAKKTPNLQNLHERAKKIFDMEVPPYMPHLSLLYGMFPVETKREIIKEIGRQQKASWEVNKVTLVRGGEIKDWKIVAQFDIR